MRNARGWTQVGIYYLLNTTYYIRYTSDEYCFPFYTDGIIIVILMKTRGKLNGEATSREIETNRI